MAYLQVMPGAKVGQTDLERVPGMFGRLVYRIPVRGLQFGRRAKEPVTGRAALGWIELTSDMAPRRQAEIRLEDGDWWVVDLGDPFSSTLRNGHRIGMERLEHGDILEFGAADARVRFLERLEGLAVTDDLPFVTDVAEVVEGAAESSGPIETPAS
jgi:hypothetical protein